MLPANNPCINDSIEPDLKVYWKNQKLNQNGNCNIFTYGQGVQMAIAVFKLLYPNHQILKIEKI